MSLETSQGLVSWYAVLTKPKQEQRAETNLRAWNIEAFTPKFKDRRRRRRQGSDYSFKPLFPRYVFARFDPQCCLHRVTFTRGVHSIVHFGDSLARIDDKIISIIQLRMDTDGLVRVGEEFKCGDPVMIDYGPFKSLIGIFERDIGDAERVRILLTTISYQAHLTVDKHSITKAPAIDGGTDRIAQLNTKITAGEFKRSVKEARELSL
ncbi:MAG TPA: transcription termination/antitermination NusG family protein [Pyrinomonadaceae bacterium]|nr:transcription termination/antitermination NusG family protein [Pyrinomonadaceae bacterium]